jgi:uncharacterized protein
MAKYYPFVAQCIQALKTLEIWLDKAQQHAAAKKFDINILMSSRLAPDMEPFTYQVSSACDYVKGAAARLTGAEPPKHADTEKTIKEVRERIKKTLVFAESLKEEAFEGAEQRKIKISFGPKDRQFLVAQDYVVQIMMPNIYFHLTMAYALLRHNGVDVGKMDFLGPISWTQG